jgi:DNA-binding response OmpR family regulator
MINILLVEDDLSLSQTMSERLSRDGYKVYSAVSLAAARTLFANNVFNLVVLDVGLPDGNGFELAAEFKKVRPTPFIFVTAMNSAEHRLRGYELGADEYIPKPFHLKEFLLRVQRVLERSAVKPVKVGSAEIDLFAMSIKYADGRVEYPTSRDFKILKHLIESAPKVVSREELVKDCVVDANEGLPTFRTIDNSIVRLRDLLEPVAPEAIRAVRGVGYQWMVS